MEIVTFDRDFIYFKGKSSDGYNMGAQYVKSKNAWKVPISMSVMEDFADKLDVGEFNKLAPLISELHRYRTEVLPLKAMKDSFGDERLRPYQRVDVSFIKSRNSTAVFNEQRTGKTPTILLAVADKLGRGIVVCPSGLKINWAREYKSWLARDDVAVVSGSPKKREKIYQSFKDGVVHFLTISYETLRVDYQKLMDTNIDVLIIDEAHRLRNFKTKQSSAIYALAKRAESVYPMTGTPAVNHPSDVYGILKLLKPFKYSSYWAFIDRYFGYVETRFGRQLLGLKPERESEFTELLDSISVQRKRKDVMQWVPKITHRTIELEPNPTQLKHYNTILKEFRYNDNIIPNVIAQLTRLRQVCLDPELLALNGQSPKTQFIVEYLEDNKETVIIFSQFTSYLKKLHKILPHSVLLTGEQSTEEKQQAVNDIQEGKAKVMLANIIAGGTGWTLDQVDTIIFADKSFNPVDNDQAEDRFVPTDPNKVYGAKQIIDLILDGTVENRIAKLLFHKTNIIQYVNNYGLKSIVNPASDENNIGESNEIHN